MYDDRWEDIVNPFHVEATTDTIGGKEDDCVVSLEPQGVAETQAKEKAEEESFTFF